MNLEAAVIALAVTRRTAYSRTIGHEIRSFVHITGADQLPNPDRLYVEGTALIAGDGQISLQRQENGRWLVVARGLLQEHPGISPVDVNAWVDLHGLDRLDMRLIVHGNWQGGSKLRISYDQTPHPLTPDI